MTVDINEFFIPYVLNIDDFEKGNILSEKDIREVVVSANKNPDEAMEYLTGLEELELCAKFYNYEDVIRFINK